MPKIKPRVLRARKLGLKCDQSHTGLVYAAGWFDKNGSLLGHGVLDKNDFLRIAKKLKSAEFFIILPTGEARNDKGYKEKIDFSYLVNNAQYVIASGQIYKIDRWNKHNSGEEVSEFKQAQYISKKRLIELLTK